MARLASQAKMGFYPTPPLSLGEIKSWLQYHDDEQYEPHALLDPCCGEGGAIGGVARFVGYGADAAWGIEIDVDRVVKAAGEIGHAIQGSIFDARIEPPGCVGLLWLNPPYDQEGKGRMEMAFLKHSIKWLAPKGVLVFIVPEGVIQDRPSATWIGRHFEDLTIRRLVQTEYPLFKQVVLFGVKRAAPVEPEAAEIIAQEPYLHLDDRQSPVVPYTIPSTPGPSVFQPGVTISNEDIAQDAAMVVDEVGRLCATAQMEAHALSPILPLRKGHLVALLTAGLLDGKVNTPTGELVIKGYSTRVQYTRMDEAGTKEITTDTYAVGIRVLDLANRSWYDIK